MNRRKPRGGENPAFTDRLVTEITGVAYYDGNENPDAVSQDRFFYDDRKRLERWISTGENYRSELRFIHESDRRIGICGEWISYGRTESIAARIDLDAAGLPVGVDYAEEYFRFGHENGQLALQTDPHGQTVTYDWSGGDLTSVRVTPNPYPQPGEYVESSIYGSDPDITNLDLNYFAYGTEYFALIVERGVGQMLGMAGFFGRNAHYVKENQLRGGDHGRYRWTFDPEGYPTGWTVDYQPESAPEKNTRWQYTIRYND